MRALLDVNVLIALVDAGHTMHARAMAWLKNQACGSSGSAHGTGHL
jgi:predicted nucleic acid-binding protein